MKNNETIKFMTSEIFIYKKLEGNENGVTLLFT